MATIDEVLNKAKIWAQTAADKSQEAYQISKYKIKIAELKKRKNQNFIYIGKSYYNSVKDASELPDFAAVIEEIDLLDEEIEENKDKINAVKNTVCCPACGSFVGEESEFCPKCGERLD